MERLKNSKGFTLLELMTILVLLGFVIAGDLGSISLQIVPLWREAVWPISKRSSIGLCRRLQMRYAWLTA